MDSIVRWGILGAAGIAVKKVVPGMRGCKHSKVVAIASRSLAKSEQAAAKLGIPRAYGSYEELLADPDIDAIYNPLPNDLHVPFSIRILEAGKHVLCEKPLALHANDIRSLITARDRAGLQAAEAFMIRCHPQWLRARELVTSGGIGIPKLINSTFSYTNTDPNNIRNRPESGGGGLMDIGCYPIHTARFLFGREPQRVLGLFEYDPELKIDRLTSGLLDFAPGHAIFSCSTQLVPFQRFEVFGTTARVEIEIPYNAPPDLPTRIQIDDGSKLAGQNSRLETFPIRDQYGLQADAFASSILTGAAVPVSLEEGFANMAVIDALFRSGESGRWEEPERLT
jgi:predicted dehydrogenase